MSDETKDKIKQIIENAVERITSDQACDLCNETATMGLNSTVDGKTGVAVCSNCALVVVQVFAEHLSRRLKNACTDPSHVHEEGEQVH